MEAKPSLSIIAIHLPYRHKKSSLGSKKEPRELAEKKWRRPTLPQLNAVPSARVGLTSLFGMGRGGTPTL